MKENKLLWIILFNLVIIVSELVFGVISNSFALIADALHNTGDVIAIIITYIAIRLASKKITFKYTFGFLKAEMMAAFTNTLFLVITMFYMIYEAINRFYTPEIIEPIYMIVVGLIAVVANGLSAYILKYDMKHDNIIYNMITKYIINLIKDNPQSLTHFASTLRRNTYSGKHGKFHYPELYPFEKDRYSSPIPELKKVLTHIDALKKQLKHKESELNKITRELDMAKKTLSQIEFAVDDTKEIIDNLKKRYEGSDLKGRFSIVQSQHKHFDILVDSLKKKIENYEKEKSYLKKNISGFQEKNKEILNKEEEVFNTIFTNLKKHKIKL